MFTVKHRLSSSNKSLCTQMEKNLRTRIIFIFSFLTLLSGCVATSNSEQAFGMKLSKYEDAVGNNLATVEFSGDKQYETEKGVPLNGEPVICTSEGLKTTFQGENRTTTIKVTANEPLTLTSIVKWFNAGWEKSCWPFVSFTPEAGEHYVLVNERIGGKGVSALWTGVAFQSCEVSVYQVKDGETQKIPAKEVEAPNCTP